MKKFAILLQLIAFTYCNGQNLNLVPVDSSNFMIIADTLYDCYKFLPDDISKGYELEKKKYCPCTLVDSFGVVSFNSSSFFIKYNKCMYIYRSDSDYYARVGMMTINKDDYGKSIWHYSIKKMNKKTALEVISLIRIEILKADIPKYSSVIIANDGVAYTFGDIVNKSFATTPVTGYSDSIIKLIHLSDKLIRKMIN
jgi:hypothetical protein